MRNDHNSGRLSVLLVDDDEDAHFFLKRDLKKSKQQLDVSSVFDGPGAVALFRRGIAGEVPLPDCVLLDVKMPLMNGHEVLTWAKEHGLLGRVVFAMLSSSEHPFDVSRAMALGAHTYLGKPAKLSELEILFDSVLRLRKT